MANFYLPFARSMLVKAFCCASMYLIYKKSSPSDGMSGELSPSEAIQLIYKEIKEIRDELANINCLRSLLTKKELADYLKVSQRTIENLVNRGEIVPIMIGTSPRFKMDEIERFLKEASSSYYRKCA